MKKGKIKNLTGIFRRYENRYLSLNRRFVLPDDRSDRFIELYKRVCDRSYLDNLLHPIDTFKVGMSKFDFEYGALLSFINFFTCHEEISDEDVVNKKKLFEAEKYVDSINYTNRDKCLIKMANGDEIKFKTITSSFNNVLKEFPDLLNFERCGQCHHRSISFTTYISDPCECVTGVCWSLMAGAKFLHSWVEINVDGDIYCLDNNYNLLMKKEDYYKIMHPRVIERISDKDIRKDEKVVKYLCKKSTSKNPYIKLYCASRDEGLEMYNKLLSKEKNEVIKEI